MYVGVSTRDRPSVWPGFKLFVGNLDRIVDEKRLRTEFSLYGSVNVARVVRDRYGRSKGFGFVCYSDPKEATKVITEMDGRTLGIKQMCVGVARNPYIAGFRTTD